MESVRNLHKETAEKLERTLADWGPCMAIEAELAALKTHAENVAAFTKSISDEERRFRALIAQKANEKKLQPGEKELVQALSKEHETEGANLQSALDEIASDARNFLAMQAEIEELTALLAAEKS